MSPDPPPSEPRRSEIEGATSRQLTEALIDPILSKLPMRSLVRFRVACKRWSLRIDKSVFVANHLERACKSHPPAIAVLDKPTCMVTILDDALDPTAFPPSSWFVGAGGHLTTPCHGLLCIPYKNGLIRLENMAINQSRVIPTPPNYTMDSDVVWCFFRYHPVTEHYKIINFFYYDDPPNLKLGCEVYTVGSDLWRRIEDPDVLPLNIGGGVCINGTVYWNTDESTDEGNAGDCVIASFDLALEKFSKILFHCIGEYGTQRGVICKTGTLFEHESSLCLAVWIPESPCSSRGSMDIWMLVGSPEKEWVNTFSFIIPWKQLHYKPLMIHDGKVIMESRSDERSSVWLGFIDLVRGNSKQIYKKGPCSYFFRHAGSLLSPNSL